ncbi:isochorismate synthase [Flavobacterium sp. MK4S-17]|uniref:isochorismate synthase n=1 Tax=Flavobacterium sp. MK4S-17 TaxID=2543737 RepID=UPI00135907A3|nr:isochorismate synthase [Flavobacterium sp. MK4S-17]
MTDIFLKIKEQLGFKRPFAVYSKPSNDVLTGIFQKEEGFYEADYCTEGFVFVPFNQGKTIFIPKSKSDIIITKIKDGGVVPTQSMAMTIDSDAKELFEQLVQKSVNAIRNGEFEKLVTSRTEAVNYNNDIIGTFSRLLYTYPNAFRYCFYSPESGLWMGATPEQLLKIKNNTLHTVALAGTQLYMEDANAVWEEKEKAEQQFVTDYILKSLEGHTQHIQATAPYTFRAGNLLHIKTDISAQLTDGPNQEAIINILHPTPAVCGLPKQQARQFIIDNEGYNREYYSGYLGEINYDFTTGSTVTDLFVNLRSMKLTNNEAHLFIGCGITKDSEPEKEFYETVNKSLTMRRIL